MNKEEMSDLEVQLGIVLNVAAIKAAGYNYQYVKSGLRDFYNMRKDFASYSYEQLEKAFDRAWGNVIEIKDNEELK